MSEALIMAVKDYLPDRHGVLRPTSQLVCIRSVQSSTGRRSPGGAYDLLLRAECRGDVLSDRTPRGIVAASGRLHGDAAIRRAGEASAERVVSLGGANRAVPAANEPVGLRPRSGTRSAIGSLSRSLVMGTSSAGLTCVHSLMMIGYYFGPLRTDVRVSMR